MYSTNNLWSLVSPCYYSYVKLPFFQGIAVTTICLPFAQKTLPASVTLYFAIHHRSWQQHTDRIFLKHHYIINISTSYLLLHVVGETICHLQTASRYSYYKMTNKISAGLGGCSSHHRKE